MQGGTHTTCSLRSAGGAPLKNENIPFDGSDELGNPLTSYEAVTNYNNFYEFTTDKELVAKKASGFSTSPWDIEVGGLVNNPKIFGLEDILSIEQEEKVFRMRCVEGWSMVIPWLGFPLHKLLSLVEPTSAAKYVRFETLYDPEQFPGQDRYRSWL